MKELLDTFRPKQEVKMKLLNPTSESVVVEKWYAVYVEDYDKKDVTRYRDAVTHFITKGGSKVKNSKYVNERCIECGRENHSHGWIGNLFTGEKLCPGDYILKHNGIVTKLSPKAFEILFGDTDNITEDVVDKVGQTALF